MTNSEEVKYKKKLLSFVNRKYSISVVIPSYNSKKTIRQCLNSVLNQSYQDVQEVIVVDSSDDGTDDLIRQLFPTVKLIHLSKKTFPGKARNIGVRNVSSEYIAFTDTDCIADYYWIENMIRSIKSTSYDALGGAVINGTPKSISGTLGYLNEFSFYLPGMKTGFVNCLATCNVCYKRSVFDKHQYINNHFAGEDTVFHWSIEENGGNLFFDKKIRINHMNRTGIRTVLKHQQKIGEGASLARIITKKNLFLVKNPILAITVLPWVRLLKMYLRVFKSDKNLFFKIILFFPLSLIVAYRWSLGFFQTSMKYSTRYDLSL